MKRFPMNRRRFVRRVDAAPAKPLPEAPPTEERTIAFDAIADLGGEIERVLANHVMAALRSCVGDDKAAVSTRLNEITAAIYGACKEFPDKHGTTLFLKVALSAYLHVQIGNLSAEEQMGIIAAGRRLAERSVEHAGGYEAMARAEAAARDPNVN